jgi:hypothetical protein
MLEKLRVRPEAILASCILASVAAGMASLWLSVIPSVINHHLIDVRLLGASYNQRLGFVVFLGVSIQGIVLAWLLTILTHRHSVNRVLYAHFYLLLATSGFIPQSSRSLPGSWRICHVDPFRLCLGHRSCCNAADLPSI